MNPRGRLAFWKAGLALMQGVMLLMIAGVVVLLGVVAADGVSAKQREARLAHAQPCFGLDPGDCRDDEPGTVDHVGTRLYRGYTATTVSVRQVVSLPDLGITLGGPSDGVVELATDADASHLHDGEQVTVESYQGDVTALLPRGGARIPSKNDPGSRAAYDLVVSFAILGIPTLMGMFWPVSSRAGALVSRLPMTARWVMLAVALASFLRFTMHLSLLSWAVFAGCAGATGAVAALTGVGPAALRHARQRVRPATSR